MSEGVAIPGPSGIECEIISDRYSDVIIASLKDLKYRYGLYWQENIPFLLFDFKVIDFALPLVAADMTEEAWEQFSAQKEISCRISFRKARGGSSLFETNLTLEQAMTDKLMPILAEQRNQYDDAELASQMISRLKGMVSAEYMIRNAEMDTPWPYKSLCRKLVPGRYWFTKKGTVKVSAPSKSLQ